MLLAADPMIGIDPTPFTAWGVLGLLAVVVLVLVGIIWKLFNKSTAAMESQTKTLMDFVNGHRRETSLALDTMTDKTNKTMDDVANKVVSSQDRMVEAFGKMSKMINELVLLERIYDNWPVR